MILYLYIYIIDLEREREISGYPRYHSERIWFLSVNPMWIPTWHGKLSGFAEVHDLPWPKHTFQAIELIQLARFVMLTINPSFHVLEFWGFSKGGQEWLNRCLPLQTSYPWLFGHRKTASLAMPDETFSRYMYVYIYIYIYLYVYICLSI